MFKKLVISFLAFVGCISLLLVIGYLILSIAPNRFLGKENRAMMRANEVSGVSLGTAASSFLSLPSSVSTNNLSGFSGDATVDSSSNSISNFPSKTQNRMIIKRVYIDLIVKDPAHSIEQAQKIANHFGGFVVSSSLRNTEVGGNSSSDSSLNRASITFRVPATKLSSALLGLRKIAPRVINENISGQDVTADYIDQQSRLKNLQAAEAKLKDIMNKASRSRDVLAAYNEVVKIRGQIDQAQGRIKYYKESVNLSSVTANFKAQERKEFVSVSEWKIKATVKNTLISLLNVLNSIVSFMLRFLFLYLPVIVVCCVPLLLFIWIFRVFKRK